MIAHLRLTYHTATKLRRHRGYVLRLSHGCSLLCQSLLALLLEEPGLFLKQVPDILQKTLLVVENVVLVFNKSDAEDMEDALWAG